jgi:DNA-directed RNA polymerase specialized sigma24 family protein
MKPFNYPERLRLLREAMDAEVARFVLGAKGLSYAQIAARFSCPVERIKTIAERAGIRRGRGWRPKV